MAVTDERRLAANRAVRLLNEFSIDYTAIVDDVIGTEHAGNAQIHAVIRIAVGDHHTTAALSESTGLSRRSLNTLVTTLSRHRLVQRRRDRADGRSILVVPTPHGRRELNLMVDRLDDFFVGAAPRAKDIVNELESVLDLPAATPVPTDIVDLIVRTSTVGVNLADAHRRRSANPSPRGRELLALLSMGTHEVTRPSVLADELRLSTGGVSSLLDRLERRNWIHRAARAGEDRRAVEVTLTPDGQRLVDSFGAAVLECAEELRDLFVAIEWYRSRPHDQRL